MRIFRHTLTQVVSVTNTDRVIGHTPVPSESSLNGVWAECHMIGSAGVDVIDAFVYGVDGRLMDDTDPGDTQSLDTLWDLLQLKDSDVSSGSFTMDPDVSDASPMFEPGEPSLEAIMGMAFQEKNQFFKRRKMITFATNPRGFVDGAPDTYIPSDAFKFHSRRNIFSEVMANAVLVYSNPAMDDVSTNTANTFNTEAKWMQLKYLEVVLEQAWMELMGLTETGAETPWEQAALLVEEVLEPTVIEESSGNFVSASMVVYCKATWDITVPGRKEFKTISAA